MRATIYKAESPQTNLQAIPSGKKNTIVFYLIYQLDGNMVVSQGIMTYAIPLYYENVFITIFGKNKTVFFNVRRSDGVIEPPLICVIFVFYVINAYRTGRFLSCNNGFTRIDNEQTGVSCFCSKITILIC